MNEDLKEMLLDCFTDVMEKMAFMFVEEAESDEIPVSSDDNLKVEMEYIGKYTGKLILVVQRDMIQELSANILGTDPDDENIDQIGNDALREILNVTCGNILTTHFGEELVFDLSVPVVTKIDAPKWKAFLALKDSLKMLVDECPVMLIFEQKKL